MDDTICISDFREKRRMWPRGKESTLLRCFFTIMQSLIHTQRQAYCGHTLQRYYIIYMLFLSAVYYLILHTNSLVILPSFCASSHSIFACALPGGSDILVASFSRRVSEMILNLNVPWRISGFFKLNGFVRFRRSFCGYIYAGGE